MLVIKPYKLNNTVSIDEKWTRQLHYHVYFYASVSDIKLWLTRTKGYVFSGFPFPVCVFMFIINISAYHIPRKNLNIIPRPGVRTIVLLEK